MSPSVTTIPTAATPAAAVGPNSKPAERWTVNDSDIRLFEERGTSQFSANAARAQKRRKSARVTELGNLNEKTTIAAVPAQSAIVST
jgi:hypothetical protein